MWTPHRSGSPFPRRQRSGPVRPRQGKGPRYGRYRGPEPSASVSPDWGAGAFSATKLPRCGTVCARPSSRSALMALRTVLRATPSSSTSVGLTRQHLARPVGSFGDAGFQFVSDLRPDVRVRPEVDHPKTVDDHGCDCPTGYVHERSCTSMNKQAALAFDFEGHLTLGLCSCHLPPARPAERSSQLQPSPQVNVRARQVRKFDQVAMITGNKETPALPRFKCSVPGLKSPCCRKSSGQGMRSGAATSAPHGGHEGVDF